MAGGRATDAGRGFGSEDRAAVSGRRVGLRGSVPIAISEISVIRLRHRANSSALEGAHRVGSGEGLTCPQGPG